MPVTLLLGAGGTGMRNLARLLLDQGEEVIAADAVAQEFSALAGAQVIGEKEAEAHVARADRIVHSDALAADHPLLTLSRTKGKTVLAYHDMVAELTAGKVLVAVAGTHGKSSTTAMLGHILIAADLDPTVLVGADVLAWGSGARSGKGELFILEADEYRDHFLAFNPAHVIVTGIDFDHPDYFASLAEVEQSFGAFFERLADDGSMVTLPEVKENHPQVPWPETTVLAARPEMKLRVPGEHMLDNAALALTMAVYLGVPTNAAVSSLENFRGLSRRTEVLGNIGDMLIISDYGHHPAAIAATYAALRRHYAHKKILALFEPHTLQRLISLRDDFVAALAQTDGVLLLPVFVPRGREEEAAEANELVAGIAAELAAKKIPVQILASGQEVGPVLKKAANTFAVAVAFTAGSLDQHLRDSVMRG